MGPVLEADLAEHCLQLEQRFWPKSDDIMEYPEEDIVQGIAQPKELNRGVFQVSELLDYWD